MKLFPPSALLALGLTLVGSYFPAVFAADPALETADPNAVVLGFETGDWKGIELSTDHVKTSTHSGLWKDHPVNKSVSSGKILHDWSGFNEMRLWIYNAGKSPISVMVVLVSQSDRNTFSYFGYRLTVDWDGWKELSIPFTSFQPNRDPVGWQTIDSVIFAAEGWSIKPDPDAVLYLDGLTLRHHAADAAPKK
ncbi:hypothetical protein BH09VER1_BH09VER1_43050 [soil metagenome]